MSPMLIRVPNTNISDININTGFIEKNKINEKAKVNKYINL